MGKWGVVQECSRTGLTEAFIEHKSVARFLINIHSFHNVHLLRSVLPCNLTAPIPYSANRRADHDELAGQLHGTREIKRKETAGKRKATEAAKKGFEGGGPSKRTQLGLLQPDTDTT